MSRQIDDAALSSALDPIPDSWDEAAGLRFAAVLAPIILRGDEDCLLLTQRRADLPHHAGQISFPGGAREGSETPLECALRESQEEIGLGPEQVTILGSLPVRESTSSFAVHTLVGRVATGVELHPDPREVVSLLEVPMARILDESLWEDRPRRIGGRSYRPSPHFLFGEHLIWGLTGRVIRDLRARF